MPSVSVVLLAHGCEGARLRLSSPPHTKPRFSCVVSTPVRQASPLTPRHPLGERENPRPFTGLLAVAAVSYLGLRGAPLYRRTATLGSPPHLLHSVSYSLSLSDLASRSHGLPSSAIFAHPVLFSPRRACRVRLSGFLSDTFASPTSVTRDCRDSENIDAVGELPRLLVSYEAYERAGSTCY